MKYESEEVAAGKLFGELIEYSNPRAAVGLWLDRLKAAEVRLLLLGSDDPEVRQLVKDCLPSIAKGCGAMMAELPSLALAAEIETETGFNDAIDVASDAGEAIHLSIKDRCDPHSRYYDQAGIGATERAIQAARWREFFAAAFEDQDGSIVDRIARSDCWDSEEWANFWM